MRNTVSPTTQTSSSAQVSFLGRISRYLPSTHRAKIALAGIFVVLYAIGTQGVEAWRRADVLADPAQPINIYNDCNIGTPSGNGYVADPGDAGIFAEEGDVVTVQQWNKFVCRFAGSLWAMHDWWRGRTPFLWNKENTNGGKLGTYVNAILLAYGAEGVPSEWGYESGINFYNAQSLFPQANQTAQFTYTSDPVDKLQMRDFDGGVRITYTRNGTYDSTYNTAWSAGSRRADGPPAGVYQDYLIGWERINLNNTEPFRVGCIYRMQEYDGGGWHYWRYPEWVWDGDNGDGSKLSYTMPMASSGEGIPKNILVCANQKNIVFDSPPANSTYSSNCSQGNFLNPRPVLRIERLCLPSYGDGSIGNEYVGKYNTYLPEY